MKLKGILNGMDDIRVEGNIDCEILGVNSDSRKIKKGFLFVAVVGYETDGHKYIEKSIENGASAIMIQEGVDISEEKIPDNITIIVSGNSRKDLAKASCNFYDNPSKKFTLIGITGTKGKTTTTFMIKNILERAGKKVGLMGTVATYINGKKTEDSERTNPESPELQKTFAKMVKEGVEYAVIEVSSQALKLYRVDGCDFNIVAFTNFSEDHIGARENANMEEYFATKLKLFERCNTGFINIDDSNVAKILELFPESQITTYGIESKADINAEKIKITNSYSNFIVKQNGEENEINVDIPGKFTVYNSLCAIGICKALGVEDAYIKEGLLDIKVPGRSELVENKLGLAIMIDYAHSPNSLENILKAVSSYTKGKVISVFGCGGDRDNGKRPIMGQISGEIADYTIITSDNPRTEDPKLIVDQIEEGIKKTNGKYEVIVDRTEAIKKAISMAKKEDLIVLAGKGHEPYQEINKIKYPFDERIIVNEIIKNMQ